MMRDALELGFVNDPMSWSNAYVQASTLALSVRVLCENHGCFRLSIALFSGESQTAQLFAQSYGGGKVSTVMYW